MTQHVPIRAAAVVIPRGLRRHDAAAYVGVSPSKFDQWVQQGVMPKPKRKDRVVLWDREALDVAFDALDDRDSDEQVDGFFS